MKKAVLEAAALKHLGRWHKTNIEEELMKARAFIAALIAQEASESAGLDEESYSLKGAEKIGTLWRTTSGRLQIQLADD
jgi:hypothetical protein